ncbi:hypothetical protein MF672_032360 [Actinomadura sp. ATCC 31491]|uniref:DoxX family membrane protein n=1 Tax=Actinomadura luzonensis TaxID=2805427 RepID=A0ABT0G1F6_9ACTN|nr:hypothetical protein [Actinomadura luzonensis]MCK2218454.1 hypothetical protein [Actinomadura luzonensis]
MATTVNRPVTHAGVRKAERNPVDHVWAIARIAIGWVFLWAFLDKTFGWGFATPAAKAWINGGSPTTGFLKGTGEHALGVGTRIAAGAGTAMLLLMWAAELPLTTNPFLDEHIVYAIVLIGLALAGAGT